MEFTMALGGKFMRNLPNRQTDSEAIWIIYLGQHHHVILATAEMPVRRVIF